MSEQQDEFVKKEQSSNVNDSTPTASSDTQTPIEADIRKTGSGDQTDAKSTAVQESGSSDPLVEGGGNQGTEKR